MPVSINNDGSPLELAVDENLHRQNLDPVEEAQAFQTILRSGKLSKKQLAERVSKTPQYVNERLRLLDLPEPIQANVADAALPVRVAPTLIRIAKVSEPVAICLAQMVADGHAEVGELEEQPDRLIGCLGDYQWPDPQPIALHVGYHRYALDSLPLPAEGCDDIRERYAALGEEVGFGFDQEDADAARGYGCLLEFKQGRFWSVQLHHRPRLHRRPRPARTRRLREATEAPSTRGRPPADAQHRPAGGMQSTPRRSSASKSGSDRQGQAGGDRRELRSAASSSSATTRSRSRHRSHDCLRC